MWRNLRHPHFIEPLQARRSDGSRKNHIALYRWGSHLTYRGKAGRRVACGRGGKLRSRMRPSVLLPNIDQGSPQTDLGIGPWQFGISWCWHQSLETAKWIWTMFILKRAPDYLIVTGPLPPNLRWIRYF
ncbi:hypothetical protein B0H10DRAFT_915228 [Mycena sp. CBHHK59/15]|nr:hypothetical protein B0H10DRAFT_915228 [Mycena sp. CBHHK59/15]